MVSLVTTDSPFLDRKTNMTFSQPLAVCCWAVPSVFVLKTLRIRPLLSIAPRKMRRRALKLRLGHIKLQLIRNLPKSQGRGSGRDGRLFWFSLCVKPFQIEKKNMPEITTHMHENQFNLYRDTKKIILKVTIFKNTAICAVAHPYSLWFSS